jgi:hypothetical protein
MAVIFLASALPGLTERLTRVASGNDPRSRKLICLKFPNVFEYPYSWEVFPQDSLGVGFDFAESNGFDSQPSTSESKSADSAE